MLQKLSGYKTYIFAIGLGIATTLHALGYLNDSSFEAVGGVLGGGLVVAARHAFSKATGT